MIRNILILSIFLLPSILFGIYTTFIYIVLKRISKKISYMLPLILTILLPTTPYILFTDIFSKATSEYEPLLPVIGYITIVVSFITPASTAAIIPVPLISKLKKGEFFVFLASTLSIFYILVSGFAEVMGAGKIGYGATKIAVVENIYITCSKIFVVSLIVYVIAVTYSKLRGKQMMSREKIHD